jgi:transposase
MSGEEVRRAGILEGVRTGDLKQIDAAELLGVGYRQAKRLWRRYAKTGRAGLIHGNAGRRSNNARPEGVRQRVLALVREHYGGEAGKRFGPTLASEHLAEEFGIRVDSETLRRWMLGEGLWSRERKSRRHRRRRQRKEHFGELLQLDGSFHEWLEERAGRGCLINMVDDATGTVLAWFTEEETTWAVADVVRAWVQKYGIPRAIYTDWKSVYHAPPEGEDEDRRLSHFGHMCAKLGIELIAANSPQAKGRVERNHGTHQDRLIKKMRRLGIGTYEEANRYLLNSYLPAHNARFARPAAHAVDFHERSGMDLDKVFCLECERTVSNDWVVRYANRLFQLEQEPTAPGQTVQVQERRDGSIVILWRGEVIGYREIACMPQRVRVRSGKKRPSITRPPATHPWKRERTVAPKTKALWK